MATLNEDAKNLPKPEYRSEPYYSKNGDCIFYYFENVKSYRNRIDEVLTVYRAFDDHRIIGCQIKGISALVRRLKDDYAFREVDFRLVLAVSEPRVGEGDDEAAGKHRPVYRDLSRIVGERPVPDLEPA